MTHERTRGTMGAGRNTVTLYLTIVGGAIFIGLVLFAPWPVRAVLIVAAVGTALAALFKARRRRSDRLSQPKTDFRYAPPTNVKRARISDVLLPTSLKDYSFLFSGTILWSPISPTLDESVVNPTALAIDAVLKRAREITEQRDPSHASLVRHELAGVLGEMQPDATGRLRAMAESVQLTLPDSDQERLDKLAAVRKEEAVWEHERKHEQSKRAYLSKDVLKDPGSAVVWWLTRNGDQVDKTVQDIGLLAQLSSAANNTKVPEAFHHFVPVSPLPNTPEEATYSHPDEADQARPPTHDDSPADHFESFLRSMQFDEDDPQRRLFARQVADWAAMYGRQGIADELINRFDPPNDTESAEEAEDGR